MYYDLLGDQECKGARKKMKAVYIKTICIVAIGLFFFSSSAFAQNAELKLLFEQDGQPIVLEKLMVNILDTKTKAVLYSQLVPDNSLVLPTNVEIPELFDVELSFDGRDLKFEEVQKEHFNGEWVIDYTDYGKKKGNCKGLLTIFTVTFRPEGRAGTISSIGQCLPLEAVSVKTGELKLTFEQDGKPLAVKKISLDILDSKTDAILHTLKASGNVIPIPVDVDLPESFDVRVIFDDKELKLNDLNRNFFDGDWVVGFRDYKKRQQKCKGLLRIFRTDFHITGKAGVYWLVSECLPNVEKR